MEHQGMRANYETRDLQEGADLISTTFVARRLWANALEASALIGGTSGVDVQVSRCRIYGKRHIFDFGVPALFDVHVLRLY